MHAMNLKLWDWPVLWREPPDRRQHYEPDNPEGRWLMLEAASAARRQAAE
jgi:hypothetical protein